ncbi:hypothetical protein B0T26DRAFT_679848 [Lasiosphaeria miniovina]|uniref:Uncharacterized protein n=1 Tax=Lasiosphaeria miniovina TaxID=1954250 RepID=A0AA39ZYT1_9PEZI|nr:uncharacterized protein B0T26DRAFT_679848 [Lasiosphaeria miniovina]KAK0706124.1 hypothetical protein B0T26DRAFT_679848 [Lasiosphaeria miniovina]
MTSPIASADKRDAEAAGLIATPPSSAQDLFAQADQRVFCKCSSVLDRSDCDAAVAVADMKKQILNYGGTVLVPIGKSYYSKRGGVVAFICTRKGNAAISTLSEAGFADLLGVATQKCGLYVPGTYKHGNPTNSAASDVGYIMSSKEGFRADAERSNKVWRMVELWSVAKREWKAMKSK